MATAKKSNRGGARPGAGRPASDDTRSSSITGRVTEAEKAIYDQLGGIAWLRKQIARQDAKLDTFVK